jgi:hypothetical protein
MAAVRDRISEDLLIDEVRTLEKQHWMLRAHSATTGKYGRARDVAGNKAPAGRIPTVRRQRGRLHAGRVLRQSQRSRWAAPRAGVWSAAVCFGRCGET